MHLHFAFYAFCMKYIHTQTHTLMHILNVHSHVQKYFAFICVWESLYLVCNELVEFVSWTTLTRFGGEHLLSECALSHHVSLYSFSRQRHTIVAWTPMRWNHLNFAHWILQHDCNKQQIHVCQCMWLLYIKEYKKNTRRLTFTLYFCFYLYVYALGIYICSIWHFDCTYLFSCQSPFGKGFWSLCL